MPEITLGADPELILLDQHNNLLQNHWTCRDFDEGRRNKFGQDTGGRTLELRPTPSTNPRQVVTRLKNIMTYACRKHPDLFSYKAVAGSIHDYPLGGHIHLGLPFASRHSYDVLVNVLDYFIALPLFLLEKPEEQKSRGVYHALGAYDIKNFGLEYRTPPSWLGSKGVALSTLCIAKIVGEEWVHRPEWAKGMGDPRLLDQRWRQRYGEGEQSAFQDWMPEIQRKLSLFSFFPTYKTEVCFLWWLLKEKKTWDTEKSIFEKWKIHSKKE